MPYNELSRRQFLNLAVGAGVKYSLDRLGSKERYPQSFEWVRTDLPANRRIQEKTGTVSITGDNLNPNNGAATYQTIENGIMYVKFTPLVNGEFGLEETVATSESGKFQVDSAVSSYNGEPKVIYLDDVDSSESRVFNVAFIENNQWTSVQGEEHITNFIQGGPIAVSEDDQNIYIGVVHSRNAVGSSEKLNLLVTTAEYNKAERRFTFQYTDPDGINLYNLDDAKIRIVGNNIFYLDKPRNAGTMQLGETDSRTYLRREAIGNHLSGAVRDDSEPADDFLVDQDVFALKRPTGIWEFIRWNNFGKESIPLNTDIVDVESIYDFARLNLSGIMIVGKTGDDVRKYTYGYGGLTRSYNFDIEAGNIRSEGVSNGKTAILLDQNDETDFIVRGNPTGLTITS